MIVRSPGSSMGHAHRTAILHPRRQTDAGALSGLWDRAGHRQYGRRSMIADYQCPQHLFLLRTQHFLELVVLRIDDMEARRMTGSQQLCIGTDDGQPQGLEF